MTLKRIMSFASCESLSPLQVASAPQPDNNTSNQKQRTTSVTKLTMSTTSTSLSTAPKLKSNVNHNGNDDMSDTKRSVENDIFDSQQRWNTGGASQWCILKIRYVRYEITILIFQ